jgi:hemerythrin
LAYTAWLLQVHELTVALTTTRSERDSAESERDRLKELHTQVKAALQESYSREQALMKQVGYQQAVLCC